MSAIAGNPHHLDKRKLAIMIAAAFAVLGVVALLITILPAHQREGATNDANTQVGGRDGNVGQLVGAPATGDQPPEAKFEKTYLPGNVACPLLVNDFNVYGFLAEAEQSPISSTCTVSTAEGWHIQLSVTQYKASDTAFMAAAAGKTSISSSNPAVYRDMPGIGFTCKPACGQPGAYIKIFLLKPTPQTDELLERVATAAYNNLA